MMTNDALHSPLERAFFYAANLKPHELPSTLNYPTRYSAKVNALRTSIYPAIDGGLSALSKEKGGIYTGHDSKHFDEVVTYAGQLIGDAYDSFNCFELYLLLMSIRVHDVGNICGRDEHETRCLEILNEISDIADDTFEIQLISRIAGAHGGRHGVYGKDTIAGLSASEDLGSFEVRAQMLAAITRFADEICETSRRASTFLLLKNLLPEQNEIYHRYAYAVKASVIKDRTLHLTYQIPKSLLSETWEVTSSDGETRNLYLSDYILDRLEKINTERVYYNQYVDRTFQVVNIRAKIQVVEGDRGDVVTQETVNTVSAGYPDNCHANPWRREYSKLEGPALLRSCTKAA